MKETIGENDFIYIKIKFLHKNLNDINNIIFIINFFLNYF